MQWLKAFITITRLPNAIFIFCCQMLVHWFVQYPVIETMSTFKLEKFSTFAFCLSFSTFLIAIAGYIINDYFDVKIDEKNKPNRVTVELTFRRRRVIIAHILLNLIALVISGYIAIEVGHISLVGIQLFCILLLVYYSASLKRKVLVGNFAIALLTLLTVAMPILYLASVGSFLYLFKVQDFYFKSWVIILCFSFLLTMIRELVKDVEDYKGDAMDGCKTLPIAHGIASSKNWCFVLLGVTIFQCIYASYYYSVFNYTVCIFYVCILLGLMVVIQKLIAAVHPKEFKWISRLLKIVTFVGILQIAFL